MVIRSLLGYGGSFLRTVSTASGRALLSAHRGRPLIRVHSDRSIALRSAIHWLITSQRPDGGCGSYHLVNGWSASYPETTGYIIPTLVAASAHFSWNGPKDIALRAGEWLLAIQRNDGGWQGGRVGEDRPSIVFNTAQVLRGLLALHGSTGEKRFLDAAVRAGHWIVSAQERDGTWAKKNFLGAARVYDTYVDAPLIRLAQVSGEAVFRSAAERNLEWVLARQHTNGWWADADNTLQHNERPITHTLAYTIDGAIDSGLSVGSERAIEAAKRAASPLLDRFLATGWLRGRYDREWRGSEALITTGCAQLAIAWWKLHAITKDDRYAQGHERMLDLLIGVQSASAQGPSEVQGALPGSYPLWGRYEKFAFPNWGTKYFADALLCDLGAPPAF